jgi:hypothetical protein
MATAIQKIEFKEMTPQEFGGMMNSLVQECYKFRQTSIFICTVLSVIVGVGVGVFLDRHMVVEDAGPAPPISIMCPPHSHPVNKATPDGHIEIVCVSDQSLPSTTL